VVLCRFGGESKWRGRLNWTIARTEGGRARGAIDPGPCGDSSRVYTCVPDLLDHAFSLLPCTFHANQAYGVVHVLAWQADATPRRARRGEEIGEVKL
jgi:hypothetical protein